MKKIGINQYKEKDRGSIYLRHHKHWVNLFWGKSRSFSNIKEVKKFLVVTSEFLDTTAHKLNTMYINLIQIHRGCVFQLNSTTNNIITVALEEMREHIDHLINHEFYRDQGYIIFQRLTSSAAKGIQAANKLIQEKKRLNDAASLVTLKIMLSDLEHMKKNLIEY